MSISSNCRRAARKAFGSSLLFWTYIPGGFAGETGQAVADLMGYCHICPTDGNSPQDLSSEDRALLLLFIAEAMEGQ